MSCVLTVDMKHSKGYGAEERRALQDYLIDVAELLNRVFAASLEKELRFSGGDELQGLFRDLGGAVLCFRLLRRAVFPLPLHAGFGLGDWTVNVPERDTFYQDGPAFHLAREAVEQAKGDTDRDAVVRSGDEGRDAAANAMLNAALRLTERNTAHQNELAVLLECLYPLDPGGVLDGAALVQLPTLMLERYGIAFYEKRVLQAQKPPVMAMAADRDRAAPQSAEPCAAHPRGAATAVAQAAHLTRQAVDTALRSANVYHERALILSMIERQKGGR